MLYYYTNTSQCCQDLLETDILASQKFRHLRNRRKCLKKVRQRGLEPPTLWSEARCSIQLSYCRRVDNIRIVVVFGKGKELT